jgi:putative endonuclease
MYVYVLRSEKDGSLYVGSTENLQERFTYHNKGYNSSTKTKVPWKLMRCEEYFDRNLALKRERFFKSGKGRKVLKELIIDKI